MALEKHISENNIPVEFIKNKDFIITEKQNDLNMKRYEAINNKKIFNFKLINLNSLSIKICLWFIYQRSFNKNNFYQNLNIKNISVEDIINYLNLKLNEADVQIVFAKRDQKHI